MEQLLFTLNELGVQLEQDGDEFRVHAPHGVLTDELRQSLRLRREEITQFLRSTKSVGDKQQTTAMDADSAHRHQAFPLTDLQHAYWVGRDGALEMGDVATHLYVEFDCADLDIERLEQALCRMIERHDMLRAIVAHDGLQRILPTVPPYTIAINDLSAATPMQIESALADTRKALSHEVRKADVWPLFEVRASLLSARQRLHVSLDLLILDAVSIFIFFSEWSAFYSNPETQMPGFEISFRDYVLAEIELQKSVQYLAARAYWMERVDTLPAAPALHLRSDLSARKSPCFSRREARVEKPRWTKLKTLIRSQGLTPSVFLLAVFSQVLARWSSDPHFTLNVTVANRRQLHSDVNRLIGDFTTLVLHEVDCRDRKASFLEFARVLRHRLMSDLDSSLMSGVAVLREWSRRHGVALQAAMPVVFSSGLSGSGDEEVGNLEHFGTKVYSISQTSQVWLDHHVVEVNGDLVFNWDAVDAVYEDGVLDAMFGAYCRSIDRLSTEPALWERGDIVALPPEMLLRRLEANDTEQRVDLQKIHAGFVAHALAHPDAPALLSPARAMSYGELLAESTAVAECLVQSGLRPGQLVAILMRKGWEQIVAVYGVLLAGGAYMPVDADLPIARQLELLAIGEVEHVLTQEASNRDELRHEARQIHELRAGDRGTYTPDFASRLPSDIEQLAYVIFTSGTTGVPKGVMISHRAAMNTIKHINRMFGVAPRDRVLGVSSLSFDLSVYDIFGVHSAGGTLVLPDYRKGHDPVHWRELIAEHRVTLWNSAPQLMKMLTDSFYGDEVETPTLRTVLLSGDFIPLDLPDRIRRHSAQAEVVSLGGATEAAIWSIIYRVNNVAPEWTSIPYGKPLPNQTIYVYDERMRVCPDSVKGRIFIGGAGLAGGYWRDAEKTAARFVSHPDTGERLYDTGDLGRYTADGNVTILGRIDGQVKIRGHRVELGEIESVLNQMAGIRQSVVLATPGQTGERRLVAYVEPASGDSAGRSAIPALSELTIRQYLSERLPDYMVPQLLMVIEAIPLSANGKVDYRALPDFADDASDDGRDLIMPRNDIEQTVFNIWMQVIEGCDFGVTDNFFDLGADSIVATQLVRELNAALPAFNLEMHELFESLTIESLARLCQLRIEESQAQSTSLDSGASTQAADADAMLADVRDAVERFADIDFSRLAPCQSEGTLAPRSVLLTGATGWIGVHVLFELLSQTKAKVYCLMRQRGELDSRTRLIGAMKRYGLELEDSWLERIEPVSGDLGSRLGLSRADWTVLAETVDAVYHLGASLNVMVDYASHRRANVDPIASVVRLAAEHHLKPVFFCSPMAVSRRQTGNKVIVLHEERVHANPAGIPSGYAQSKWVAEQVLLAAIERGLPARIYRTSHALPSSRNGQIKPNDTYAAVLRAACSAGVVPEWEDSAFNGVPVDTFARLMVDNSLNINDNYRGVVHLENLHPLSIKSLLGILLEEKLKGVTTALSVSAEEWKARCMAAASELPEETASLVNFLFCQRQSGSTVDHMFGAHPIDVGYFERIGQSLKLSDLTPPAYWRNIYAAAGW